MRPVLPLVFLLACTGSDPEESDTSTETESEAEESASESMEEQEPIVFDTRFAPDPLGWKESLQPIHPCGILRFTQGHPMGYIMQINTIDASGFRTHTTNFALRAGIEYPTQEISFTNDTVGRPTTIDRVGLNYQGTVLYEEEITATYGDPWGPLTVTLGNEVITLTYDETGQITSFSGDFDGFPTSGAVTYDDAGNWATFSLQQGTTFAASATVTRATNGHVESIETATTGGEGGFHGTIHFVETTDDPSFTDAENVATQSISVAREDGVLSSLRFRTYPGGSIYTTSYSVQDPSTHFNYQEPNPWRYVYEGSRPADITVPYPMTFDTTNGRIQGSTQPQPWSGMDPERPWVQRWVYGGERVAPSPGNYMQEERIYDTAGNLVRQIYYQSNGAVSEHIDHDWTCYQDLANIPNPPDLPVLFNPDTGWAPEL